MALTQRLEFRQSQSLVMTPQLMQAIKLLQLSSLDLAAYVEEELERNPLLERAPEEQPGAGGDVEPEAAEGASDAPPEDWYNRDLETSRTAIERELDTDLGNVFDDGEVPAAT